MPFTIFCPESPEKRYASHVFDGNLRTNRANVIVYRRLFGFPGEESRYPVNLENTGPCCMKMYRNDIAGRNIL